MLLGSRRTANSHLPAIWSRPDGGAWSEYTGNIFGAGTEDGESPVQAVLPSSHGFIAAGWFHADGADHAGIAVSEDGTTWSHVQGGGLRGNPSMGRYIGSLAETPGGTVLAGGSSEDGTLRTASVWASSDARTWTPVLMVSGDGRQFAGVPVDHTALGQEDLSVSAIGIAGKRLMIAGTTGPADRREAFGISIDVPEP